MTETSQTETRLSPGQVQAIYVEFADGLRRFLLGVLRDAATVDDACQLTFMRLVEKGHLVQQQNSMKSWLFQVGFNEAMLIKRRQSTGIKHQESMAWYYQLRDQDKGANGSIEVVDVMLQQENIAQVREAIDKLSDVQREVVHKRIYEGKKFREIADELGVPLATVLSRMQLSLKKLEAVLKRQI